MGFGNCGCCFGMVLGFLLALAIFAAAVFGVYCYFNPDARGSSITVVERQWIKIKNSGDELIEQSRTIEPVVEEPQVPLNSGSSQQQMPPANRPGPLVYPAE